MAGGMMDWTPTRAELLAIARDIDRLRGVPNLSTEDMIERMFRARDLHVYTDEPGFMRAQLERLARCRASWAEAASGTGQQLEGLLRAAVITSEMRKRP